MSQGADKLWKHELQRCPTQQCVLRWTRRLLAAAVATAVIAGMPGTSRADRAGVLFAPTYGDPDLRQQAGAVSLLMRGSLDSNGGGLVTPYELTRQGIAPTLDRAREAIAAASARFLVFSEIDRVGTQLVGTAHVLDEKGSIIANVAASAPEGAIADLATKLTRPVADALGLSASKIPDVSLGQLRPFVRAEMLWAEKKTAEAADALAGAEPRIGLRVASAAQLARAIGSDASLPLSDRLTAMLATGVPRDVLSVSGSDASPTAHAYRALASIDGDDAAQARRELSGDSSDPVSQLARAALARLEQQPEARDVAIRSMLSAPTPMQLRWLSRLAPAALGPELEKAVLQAAAQTHHSRLAAALGLRAAEAGIDVDKALALVSVAELDASERVRLAGVVARAQGFEANRLGCETALLSGEIPAARTAATQLSQSADPRAALCRGRIAWQLGNLRVAASELERGNSLFDAARVLLSAGDPRAAMLALKKTGAEGALVRLSFLANAQIALAEARPADALALLQQAAMLAPGSWVVQSRLAELLERNGDTEGAAIQKARLATMANPGAANSGAATAAATETGSAAAVARPSLLKAHSATSNATLLKTLQTLLAGFPPELFERRGIVLARYGEEDGWWRLRHVNTDAFADHLAKALADPRHDARIMAFGFPQPMPPPADALAELAAANKAATVVLYRVRASGAIRLMAFDAETKLAAEIDGSFDASDAGMLRWNLLMVGPLGVLLVLLIGWTLWVVIRGNGAVEVHIKIDPSGSEEVLCVELSPSRARPRMGEPEAFAKLHRAEGQKVSATRVTLANAITKFRAPAGQYWVHVWGVYQRAGSQRIVDDDTYSTEIKVTRRSKQRVDFDLAPTTAELRIRVIDEKLPGIALWLDDSTAKVTTNDQGMATLFARLGTHTLHIDSSGIHIEREIALGFARIERLEFNLVRERRLVDATGGAGLQNHALEPADASAIEHDATELMPKVIAAGSTPAASPAGAVTSTPTSGFVGGAVGTSPMPAATRGFVNDHRGTGSARGTPTQPVPGVGALLLGRYKLGQILGEGAMGVVFRATDQNLEREVAIKVISRELRNNADAMRFFIEEAKALAQLNHANIVSVFDQATHGDETCLIMEFVDGRTVDAILRERTRLPVRAALALVDQLCAGLAYVHGRRIIHRDIKPANIFISKEKVVKLGDFGLARVMRELSIRRTEIRGTPLYMAPEQITGENVTHRVDLYAVGCTLFELVTGRPPFIDGEILIHHLTTAPPVPSSIEPSIPPEVDALILACIEKEQEVRIESATAIRERIQAISKPS